MTRGVPSFTIAFAFVVFVCSGSNVGSQAPDTPFGADNSGTTRISFKPAKHNGGPIISAKLNGSVQIWLIVDTGASLPAIVDTLAQELKLPKRPLISSSGVPETFLGLPIEYLRVPQLTLGDLVFQDYPLMVMPVKILDQVVQEPVHGILGAGFLIRNAMQFDIVKRELIIWKGSISEEYRHQLAKSGAASVPIRPIGHVSRVVVRINETVDETLLIDTGSSATILSRACAIRLGLKPIGRVTNKAFVHGKTNYTKARLDSFEIGGMKFTDLEILYPDKEIKNVPPLLGRDVLSRFQFLIDYPKLTMWILNPSPGMPALPTPNI